MCLREKKKINCLAAKKGCRSARRRAAHWHCTRAWRDDRAVLASYWFCVLLLQLQSDPRAAAVHKPHLKQYHFADMSSGQRGFSKGLRVRIRSPRARRTRTQVLPLVRQTPLSTGRVPKLLRNTVEHDVMRMKRSRRRLRPKVRGEKEDREVRTHSRGAPSDHRCRVAHAHGCVFRHETDPCIGRGGRYVRASCKRREKRRRISSPS